MTDNRIFEEVSSNHSRPFQHHIWSWKSSINSASKIRLFHLF